MLKDCQNEFSSEIYQGDMIIIYRNELEQFIKTNDGFEGKVQGNKPYDIKL